MPQRGSSATRYYKKKQANCKRASWAANNILSTSRKILQKTVVKLDPYVESLKKNNSDLARKNAELQKELTEKTDEVLQLQKESFQIRGELLRLQNFKDSVVSSGILEKLVLISSDVYRMHEVISDAFHRTYVSSSPSEFSVEVSSKGGPVTSPVKITSNARKPSQNRLSNPSFRPITQSVEMEIDSSISSPNSSNLSSARRTVLVDSDDVEDTVMSTPRKTFKLSSGSLIAPVSQVDEYDTAMTSSKSPELSEDEYNEDQDVDVEHIPTSLPLRESSKSGTQAVYVSSANENDVFVKTSHLRSSSQSDNDDSSFSERDPDYGPALKPRRKRAVATRKISKASGTPFNCAAHPLKIAFTLNEKDKDSNINLEISKPTSKNATQSAKTSSTSETLKRKKVEYNEPDAIVEEKKSTFENHFVEVYGKDGLEREQDKEEEKVRIENESASEAVEKKGANKDEVRNDTAERMTSTKRKSRKRKRRLRLVAEDSVFIPISDMTMEVTRGSNKENEIDDTTAAHNADEDATSPKSKLENQLEGEKEKENDVKENSEVKPKAKVSAIRPRKEQAKFPENKKSRTEPKKVRFAFCVDSEKPILRAKALSIGAVDKASEVETKRSTSLMDKRISPPSSPHRPRRQASNCISYVVKLNTKLRQGDKDWCKDK
nr:conserved hypothetical protein [Hymenolepis microstoma]